jgi:hypothetical protein
MTIFGKRKSSVKPPWRVSRRRFLTALGLGGLAASLPSLGWNAVVQATDQPPPKRLLLWITGHGTVPRFWNLDMGTAPTTSVAIADFGSLSLDRTPQILQPLDAHRRKLTIVEGLAQSTIFGDHVRIAQHTNWDSNEHTLAQAHLLTVTESYQQAGAIAIGGGKSIDQEIGDRTRVGSRWASRVYGANHYFPYSYVAATQASPRVEDPAQAFADLMGLYAPSTGTTSRDDLLRAGRASVLDLVADEYDVASHRLGTEGRQKLAQHAQLVRDLEMTFSSSALVPQCSLGTFDASGHLVDQWNRIVTLALACDMTRVITCVQPVLAPTDFGYPAEPDVHGGYAHSSVDDGNEPFQARSETAMLIYNQWYAQRFANLCTMLDSISEGTGTLLDHVNLVWLTELATGTHEHQNLPIVIAGGGDGFFLPGAYIRYPRTDPSPWVPGYVTSGPIPLGPGVSRLYVTLMRAMGLPDESYGDTSIPLADGTTQSLVGVLPEIMRS